MLNHAVRYYNLPFNPMSKVNRMDSKKTREMRFWTKDEYRRFFREVIDKDESFLLFELLCWLGIRSGTVRGGDGRVPYHPHRPGPDGGVGF